MAESAALKEEIIAFYKRVEQEIADLSVLKDDIKQLVDKWKAVQAGESFAIFPDVLRLAVESWCAGQERQPPAWLGPSKTHGKIEWTVDALSFLTAPTRPT